MTFDPDAPLSGDNIFGLPTRPEDARVVLLPVPWEATVSYGAGTAGGPAAIQTASLQLDLLDRETGRPYERGIAMLPIPADLRALGETARALAERAADERPAERADRQAALVEVNRLCAEMNDWVYRTARTWLERDKLVGVIGGDHSVPFGLIRAVAEREPEFGILQLDAHADLRAAYEGFTWSHASVMYNVIHQISGVTQLVQVGVRDYASREAALMAAQKDRIRTFFDPDLRRRLQDGQPFTELAREIVSALPERVYLSFDIDGLDPALCPNTGTPVPGGLSFPEATALLRLVCESGRRVVGFDLCEVAPDPRGDSEWDGNVGARLLYKMIGFALLSEAEAS